METTTARPSWDRPYRNGQQPQPMESLVGSSWRTGEYEAWFLAGIERLRGRQGVLLDAEPHPDPERPRDAKKQLEARMTPGATYLETTDQPALSALFSLPAAYRRTRSFRKLTASFADLVRAMGYDLDTWPPAAWTGEG